MPNLFYAPIIPTGLVTISPWSLGAAVCCYVSACADYANPTANRITYYPFRLTVPFPIRSLYMVNGSAVSGHFDVGVFTLAGAKVISTGSTVQAGINQIQAVATAETWIGPGIFYVGWVMDNAIGHILGSPFGGERAFMGFARQDATFPLPATATFASASTGSLVPACGPSRRTNP
jgi:hypothetical protein